MADTIKIGGHSFKKWEVWTVAIGGALVTYYVYRQHQATAAAAQNSADSNPDSSDSYLSQTDPLTGDTYGDEIAEYGSVSAAEQAITGSGATGAASAYEESGVAAGEDYDYYGSGVTGNTYTNNSEWASAVTAGLESLGYDATDVNSAIANYLAGLQLTSTQAAIVQTALAEFGPPPVGTFTINVASTAGGATSTGGSSSSTTSGGGSSSSTTSGGSSSSTSSSSSSTSTAKVTPAKAPGGVTAKTSGAVTTISWGAVSGASNYEFQIAEPNGALYRDGTVTVASAVFDNLVDIQKGQWHFKVRALGTGGPGPWSAVIAFTP